jgi:hypothetical protein
MDTTWFLQTNDNSFCHGIIYSHPNRKEGASCSTIHHHCGSVAVDFFIPSAIWTFDIKICVNMNNARKHDSSGGASTRRPVSRIIPTCSLVILVLFAWHSFRPTGLEKSSTNAVKAIKTNGDQVKSTCLAVPDRDWIRQMHSAKCKKLGYSQGNQDCKLDTIYQHIGTTNKFFVEYGFNTPTQCSGSGPNSCKLWKVDGWKGLLLDGSNENPEINLKAHYLYGNNAAQILQKYDVPLEPDFLSSDMDSHDYFVLSNILETFRPRIITTEYNQNWSVEYEMSQVDPTLDPVLMEKSMNSYSFKGCMWGASASALKRLLEQNGYVLIAVVEKLDLLWARKDVVDCYDVPPFEFFQDQMKLGEALHVQQNNLSFLEWLADTQVWEETKDIDKARESAKNKLVMQAKAATLPHCYRRVADLLAKLE